MNIREDKVLSLAGAGSSDLSQAELNELFDDILANGFHGICFSAYEEGQEPGVILTEEQIRRRMKILQPHIQWVRSFSCADGNELIPRIAKEFGIKTLVGAWLSDDKELNQKEIEGLISLSKEGLVDIAAVGNEVLYRKELSLEELIHYIQQVKSSTSSIPVGYVDAYYEFENRPELTANCDLVLANCYPFWEGCHIDYSLLYMKDMYRRAQRAGQGKKVIITETGWPDKGQSFHGAFPSKENAIRYFINAQLWSLKDEIDMFYFSSFDESWKVGAEGDVGAFWGLWDKYEKLKY